ncbi:hypothetical protein [Kitasatospora sp. NPDC094015]|uniref:hypothetical protein n=1 Tax=Kitasatospora sp. NPDC094015 TaxID=3155205 RepID=UPI00332DCAB9
MKSMLGKALFTAAAAVAVAGVAAPAHAHVAAGGGGEFVASAHEPFLAGEQHGWAETSHIFAAGQQWGWATATTVAGGEDGIAIID